MYIFSEQIKNFDPIRSLGGPLLISQIDGSDDEYNFAIGAYFGRWALAKHDFMDQHPEAIFDVRDNFDPNSLCDYFDALNTAIITRLLQTEKYQCFTKECFVPMDVDNHMSVGGASVVVSWRYVILGVLVTAAASLVGALIRS